MLKINKIPVFLFLIVSGLICLLLVLQYRYDYNIFHLREGLTLQDLASKKTAEELLSLYPKPEQQQLSGYDLTTLYQPYNLSYLKKYNNFIRAAAKAKAAAKTKAAAAAAALPPPPPPPPLAAQAAAAQEAAAQAAAAQAAAAQAAAAQEAAAQKQIADKQVVHLKNIYEAVKDVYEKAVLNTLPTRINSRKVVPSVDESIQINGGIVRILKDRIDGIGGVNPYILTAAATGDYSKLKQITERLLSKLDIPKSGIPLTNKDLYY